MRWLLGRTVRPGSIRPTKYRRIGEYNRYREKDKARRTVARYLEDMDDEMEMLDMLGLL